MFKRRRKDAGAVAASEADGANASPLAAAPQAPQHRRAGSATMDTSYVNTALNRSAEQNFDFQFFSSPPPFAQEPARPQTSDGIGARKSSVNFDPPVLPPIPRISSTREGPSLLELMGADQEMAMPDPTPTAVTQEPLLAPAPANKTENALTPPISTAGSRLSSFSRPSLSPVTSQKDYRESPSNSTEAIQMESSLFPTKAPVRQPSPDVDQPMSREFIDSRDKPYAPVQRLRPAPQTMNSSPDLRIAAKSEGTSPPSPTPLSATADPLFLRPAPQQAHSTGNMNNLIRPPSNPATNYSGTTARSTHSSKSTAIGSETPFFTVGTPYQDTSQSFPLPQHVQTRPRTAGVMASIGGVNVPTHHTSALNQRSETAAKTEKRKTKLLNPMFLLSRRRTGQAEEASSGVRVSQAQALQRQRNVAAVANRIPEDFDPRIKGNVVHDFSAPRDSRRMVSYNDALDYRGQMQRHGGAQSPSSSPFVPNAYDISGTQVSIADASSPRSLRTPVFTEHLSDETLTPNTAAAAIQAENLENKAFLNRAGLMSQEPSALPPFARRSQLVEPLQTSDVDPTLSLPAEQTLTTKADRMRDSHVSASSSGVSPVTQRNSALPGATDVPQDGVSPVSPSSSDKHGGLLFSPQLSRPVSEISRLGSSDGKKPYRMSEVSRLGSSDDLRPLSTFSSSSSKPDQGHFDAGKSAQNQPSIEPIAEEQTPKQQAGPFPMFGQPSALTHTISTEAARAESRSEVPPRSTSAGGSMASSRNAPSPPPAHAEQENDEGASNAGATILVQKRVEASEHGNRSSSAAKPKHNVSNASRFSFQLGGSAAEELALEQKARKLGVGSRADNSPGNDEDDDDYFDEDAMNDMDEMEVEAEREDFVGGLQAPTSLAPTIVHEPVSPLTPTFNPMIRSDEEAQFDGGSDDISEPDSDEETPYWLHDALRSYVHTREPSTVSGHAAMNSARVSHAGAQSLTIDTNLGPTNSGSFYMHPGAAANPPLTEQNSVSQRPALPHRDSGNSERNRIASGLTFGGDGATRETTLSRSTIGSDGETTDRSFNESSAGRSGSTEATGLGLSGFSGFKFIDSPDASRPTSTDVKHRFHTADRRRGDSETLPHDSAFASAGVAKFPPDPQTSSPRQDYNVYQYDLDDMYFDDGGFDGISGQSGDAVNEDAFDDDGFLDNTNRMARYDHANRQMSDIGASYAAVVGDGPYPSFARPNGNRTRQRESQLMFEDLPLQGPIDPRFIPRRNPSEDAKRLGLSDRVPPLPAQGLNADASAKLENKVHAYHAILAEAAQKAYEEGRFGDPNLLTVPSRSDSVRDQSEPAKRSPRSWDDRNSHYSRYDDDDEVPSLNGDSIRSRKDSTFLATGADYSPARMSFDFGFDSVPPDDSFMDDGLGSDADDDIVAAANAEALANDDDGFYGQEFGFYAKARPNSGEVAAINGGYFGADGDDGLSRQRSMKEPNLTPITELSEWSRRTSFIGAGMGGQMGTPGIGPFSPFTPAGIRLPVSPWLDNDTHNLRKLKINTFGDSNGSLHSSDGSSAGGMHMNPGSAPVSGRTSAAAQGYFGLLGSHPMTFGYSNDSSASSNPSSAHPHFGPQVYDSPQSATSGAHMLSQDVDATPKRPALTDAPVNTTRKISDRVGKGHSRNSSGADSVTYVREQDPDGQRPPRWVLEKRRTSEAGQLELVAREVVQDGWI